MKQNEKFSGDIITNPPYKYANEFIIKSLELTNRKVALFLRLQTLEGVKRYEQIFKNHPPKTIYVFIKRICCFKPGGSPYSSAVAYAWFVWDKNYKGETVVKWI